MKGVGIGSLVAVRRVRREVDRAVELAPDWDDALVGKGSFLIELPRFLGGDPAEGERLLREALRLSPDFLTARLNLARALGERGARDEARAEAERALAIAERKQDQEKVEEARELLGRLKD